MEDNIDRKYQWRQNWRHPLAHTNVDLVVSELKDIEDVHGQITPQLIVESAKNKKSVLHSYFNWNNDDAANRYRLKQATNLLRQVEVVVISDGLPKSLRVYETINRGGDGGTVKGNPTTLKNFELFSDSDRERQIKRLIADVGALKTRLDRLGQKEAIKHLLQCLLCLQVSISSDNNVEENKEIAPQLHAVV